MRGSLLPVLLSSFLLVAASASGVTIVDVGTPGANGTHGNPGQDGGAGGAGEDAVAHATGGDSSSRAEATGGAGGDGGNGGAPSGGPNGNDGGFGGAGGGADVFAEAMPAIGDAQASALALGGDGGDGGPGSAALPGGVNGLAGPGGGGGRATADAWAQSTGGSAVADTEAHGGDGGGRPSRFGAGHGTARSIAIGSSAGSLVEATSHATGGSVPLVGDGGGASTVSDAYADPDADARVSASAQAGQGGAEVGVGGDASATATISQEGTPGLGSAEAVSSAVAGNGLGTFGRGGDAGTLAAVQSPNAATANAFARAGIGMHDSRSGEARATAGINGGGSGAIAARAVAGGAALGAVQLVDARASGTGMGFTETRALINSRDLSLAEADGRAGAAFAAAGSVDITTPMAGNPNAQAAFSETQGIAVAVLGAGAVDEADPTSITFTSSVSYSFDLARLPLHSDAVLVMALLDTIVGGSGFDLLELEILREGTAIVDETFTDLSDALAYFDDHVFALGDIRAGVTGTLDLDILLRVTTDDPGSRFAANVIFGHVPEPSTALLFSGGLLAVAARRRRRCPGQGSNLHGLSARRF
jgi:hypothetical protein